VASPDTTMSAHLAFRRQPVPQQVAQKHTAATLPAPTRGLNTNDNLAFMKPGAAVVLDNWAPTTRGIKLRAGFIPWATLPGGTPVVSSFEYASAGVQRMFAATLDTLYEVTSPVAAVVKAGQLSGNYAASQMANAAGDWLIAVNDFGDPPLRFDGSLWEVMDAAYMPPAGKPSKITVDMIKYPDANIENGSNLVYVWKYRNRFFFIEASSMNAWYLPINAVGGQLEMIPLSGAASKGGKLLFGAVWSLDAGDGTDDKCCFVTDLGEILVFTGSDPSNAASWRQEGRYQVPAPMGMNAHINIGGDLLIATIDGIIPTSAAISKDAGQLDLAAVTFNIRSMWRAEAIDKREWPWTMQRWDEYGGMFVTWPGGKPGQQRCAVVNTSTNAWCRFTGWDATCFMMMRGELFFGTQTGQIMQADRTGYDNGQPYVATMVGGWGALQSQPSQLVWHQARASFIAPTGQPFLPQLSAATDFVVVLPTPPLAGIDSGVSDLWDQGLWDDAKWDQEATAGTAPSIRNTGWVSVGRTGYSHAPILQVMVAQGARPVVELVSIDATFERLGVNV